MRCLERYIAREVFKILRVSGATGLPTASSQIPLDGTWEHQCRGRELLRRAEGRARRPRTLRDTRRCDRVGPRLHRAVLQSPSSARMCRSVVLSPSGSATSSKNREPVFMSPQWPAPAGGAHRPPGTKRPARPKRVVRQGSRRAPRHGSSWIRGRFGPREEEDHVKPGSALHRSHLCRAGHLVRVTKPSRLRSAASGRHADATHTAARQGSRPLALRACTDASVARDPITPTRAAVLKFGCPL
jgi:hypothetical protein